MDPIEPAVRTNRGRVRGSGQTVDHLVVGSKSYRREPASQARSRPSPGMPETDCRGDPVMATCRDLTRRRQHRGDAPSDRRVVVETRAAVEASLGCPSRQPHVVLARPCSKEATMKVLAIAMLGVLAVLVVVAAWVAVPTSPSPSPAVASADRRRRRPRRTTIAILGCTDARRNGKQPPDTAGHRPRRDLDHAHGRHEAHVLRDDPVGKADGLRRRGDHVHEGRLLRHVGGRRQDGHVQGHPAR